MGGLGSRVVVQISSHTSVYHQNMHTPLVVDTLLEQFLLAHMYEFFARDLYFLSPENTINLRWY